MSATVYWTPVKSGKAVGKGSLRDALTKAFGQMPEELAEDDFRTLEIAKRMTGGEVGEEIQELIDAVEKHGAIRISVEY